MTAITPGAGAPRPAPTSCLTAGAAAGQVINVLFAVTVALFLVALFTLGPVV